MVHECLHKTVNSEQYTKYKIIRTCTNNPTTIQWTRQETRTVLIKGPNWQALAFEI